MPDFERNLSASFISSKDGAIPVAVSLWLMNINSSCCFLVSIDVSRPVQTGEQTKNSWRCSSLVPDWRQAKADADRVSPQNIQFSGYILIWETDPASSSKPCREFRRMHCLGAAAGFC